MRINIKLKIILLILFVFIFSINIAFAANLKDAFKPSSEEIIGAGPLDKAAYYAGYEYIEDGEDSIDPIIGKVIQSALSFLGVIFIILMIYGGGIWMTAQGNEQQIEKAKNLLVAAAMGLIIVVAAYAISYFILSKVAGTDAGILKNP